MPFVADSVHWGPHPKIKLKKVENFKPPKTWCQTTTFTTQFTTISPRIHQQKNTTFRSTPFKNANKTAEILLRNLYKFFPKIPPFPELIEPDSKPIKQEVVRKATRAKVSAHAAGTNPCSR
jgi:hypothetical protein